MTVAKKIKREQRQLKKFNKMKKVGTIITIVGAIIFTVASIFNLLQLFADCYDGTSEFKIFISIVFFIIKELWVSNIFKIGLFMLIMFSSFVNKKKLNIEKLEKEQGIVENFDIIDA